MTDHAYQNPTNQTRNELKFHPFIRNSFVFVPSAGLRQAPEVLVLELMRELFFKDRYGTSTGSAKEMHPDNFDEDAEQAVTASLLSLIHI